MTENWLTFSDSENNEPAAVIPTAPVQAHVPAQQKRVNHHCRQYAPANSNQEPPVLPTDLLSSAFRILDHDSAPQMQYKRRSGEIKTVAYDRFMSVLLQFIEFMSMSPNSDIVMNRLSQFPNIYLILAELFPNVTFHVFEIFQKPNVVHERVNFYNFSVTDDKFSLVKPKKEFLFVYEPSVPVKQLTVDEANQQFNKQLETQKMQFQQLNPILAMLQFELPWNDSTISFFQGEIMLPLMNSATYAGCKMITHRGAGFKDYDCKKLEEQMFYFNNNTRVCVYDYKLNIDFDLFKNFDKCFDCASALSIMLKYLKEAKNINGTEKPLEIMMLWGKLTQSRPEDNDKDTWKRGKFSKDKKRDRQ
ncbi:Conserved_hypothetical protein [Hexamita inflata]|uniref:Uncharacterized protein n=1 Tax=Hexamita inflata TaxID=28002 RepID=A0AA86V4U8_9EUKA|nr:Conserved hypothetical protein [Hexamita inflata]